MNARKNPGGDQGFLLLCSEKLMTYLVERRALMRALAEAKNAPAVPMTARIAVGFSGELVQPSWAWSGRATDRRRARPRNASGNFFIDGLQLRRY